MDVPTVNCFEYTRHSAADFELWIFRVHIIVSNLRLHAEKRKQPHAHPLRL